VKVKRGEDMQVIQHHPGEGRERSWKAYRLALGRSAGTDKRIRERIACARLLSEGPRKSKRTLQGSFAVRGFLKLNHKRQGKGQLWTSLLKESRRLKSTARCFATAGGVRGCRGPAIPAPGGEGIKKGEGNITRDL